MHSGQFSIMMKILFCNERQTKMYTYTWYQWLLIFYTYCLFGWIFESTYVSVKNRRFINRGFLRLPMLPLYGTGAVMMLWVTLPFQSSLLLVCMSGLVAATVLEYVTGWAMEGLFKIKYWDYTGQRFNLRGYICLSSSIAWGLLTLLLTEVIHRPVSRLILAVHPVPALVLAGCVTIVFTLDAVQSVRAALDLARVLDTMTRLRAELNEIQMQMALLKSETGQRMSGYRDEAAERLTTLSEKHRSLSSHMGYHCRSLLKGNPSASSHRFSEALKELRDYAAKMRK